MLYIIPTATKTKIVVSVNTRDLRFLRWGSVEYWVFYQRYGGPRCYLLSAWRYQDPKFRHTPTSQKTIIWKKLFMRAHIHIYVPNINDFVFQEVQLSISTNSLSLENIVPYEKIGILAYAQPMKRDYIPEQSQQAVGFVRPESCVTFLYLKRDWWSLSERLTFYCAKAVSAGRQRDCYENIEQVFENKGKRLTCVSGKSGKKGE